MKALRLTKAEHALILGFIQERPDKTSKGLKAKLEAAASDAPTGLNVRPIEAALIKAAHGKVIALENGHAVASRRALAAQMNEADAQLVGEWMARQHWLTGPMTLFDILNKWNSWLPKARATQPPPALQAGLGTDGTGPSPAKAGPAAQGRRPPPGLR